ncbi:porin [Microbulbifer halophilus]|uniref:porin n=1 Tax=Microbulbifer halophilus TaxID=453963 RepID=UPI003612CAAF
MQRLAGQYNIGPVQVGALFEEQEKADGSTQDGWMASAAYSINRWTAKAQYGQSDVVVADAETYSLGLDYKLSSAAKVFGFYTDETAADDYDRSYFGIGTEFNSEAGFDVPSPGERVKDRGKLRQVGQL